MRKGQEPFQASSVAVHKQQVNRRGELYSMLDVTRENSGHSSTFHFFIKESADGMMEDFETETF